MAASGLAVGFEWTPFNHGFVYWEYLDREHLPPPDEAGQREWLEGFLQAHADSPSDSRNGSIPSSAKAHTRRLDGCWRVDVMWMHYWHRWSGC